MLLSAFHSIAFAATLWGASFGAPGRCDSLLAEAVASGHWSASVDSATEATRPGPLFKIRGLSIRDENGIHLEGLSLAGFAGAPADRKNLEALQGEVRRYLLDHGFPFAVIDCDAQADSLGQNAVDVAMRVRRGDAFKVGGFSLVGGETKLKPEAAQRLMLWKIGEPYSQERLDLGLRRLRRTGYFESAEWDALFRDSARNLLYPALRLVDAHENRLAGLLGYDSKTPAGSDGLTGFLDIHLVNLFGTARDFDFNFESRAAGEREARLGYVEPWLFGLDVGVRLELGFLQQDSAFWEWNRGLVFFQDLGYSSRLELQLANQENQDAASRVHSQALQSGLRLVFDRRDRVPFTLAGTLAEASVTGVRREISDSSYYLVQIKGAVTAWLPITRRVGFKWAGRAGTNLPLADRFNRGELYYLGGARSLRGYREREFQTNAYVLGVTEAQLSMGRGSRLFAFADPGFVNRLVGEYDWRRVLGYGAGIELAKGDWSLAVSYALNPERSPGDGLLHVGVDNRF